MSACVLDTAPLSPQRDLFRKDVILSALHIAQQGYAAQPTERMTRDQFADYAARSRQAVDQLVEVVGLLAGCLAAATDERDLPTMRTFLGGE